LLTVQRRPDRLIDQPLRCRWQAPVARHRYPHHKGHLRQSGLELAIELTHLTGDWSEVGAAELARPLDYPF
jgi:hypothetical protein